MVMRIPIPIPILRLLHHFQPIPIHSPFIPFILIISHPLILKRFAPIQFIIPKLNLPTLINPRLLGLLPFVFDSTGIGSRIATELVFVSSSCSRILHSFGCLDSAQDSAGNLQETFPS